MFSHTKLIILIVFITYFVVFLEKDDAKLHFFSDFEIFF